MFRFWREGEAQLIIRPSLKVREMDAPVLHRLRSESYVVAVSGEEVPSEDTDDLVGMSADCLPHLKGRHRYQRESLE